MAQKDFLRLVIDFGDESISVPFDVKYRELADGIGRRKHSLNLNYTFPFGSLGDSIPDVQRPSEIPVSFGRLKQFLPADNVQASLSHHLIRKMRTCQAKNSQIANSHSIEEKHMRCGAKVGGSGTAGNKKGSDCSEPFLR
jgi:hypothetical protein